MEMSVLAAANVANLIKVILLNEESTFYTPIE